MAKYIDIEPLEKDGWMLRRNTFTIDGATVELKHLRDFPTVEISDIITSDNEYMGSVVQGRWIPVTERLPEKEGQYLLSCDTDYGVEVGRFYIDEDGERYFGCDWNDPDDIQAWMPLPEPYKGGEEE